MNFKQYIPKNNLKKLRTTKNLTQQDVADILGLNAVDRISRWENGTKAPNLINLFRLSGIYEVSVESLYPDLAYSTNPSAFSHPEKGKYQK